MFTIWQNHGTEDDTISITSLTIFSETGTELDKHNCFKVEFNDNATLALPGCVVSNLLVSDGTQKWATERDLIYTIRLVPMTLSVRAQRAVWR